MSGISFGAWLCCALVAATAVAQSRLSQPVTRLSTSTASPATSRSEPIAGHEPIDGHWEGTIKAPGMPLAVTIDFKRQGESLIGTIDIPQQGQKALKLESIRVDGPHLTFSIRGLPGKPRFDGQLRDQKIAGTFSQSFMNLPFELSRERVAALIRPQEPKEPFPYRREEVSYKQDGVTLAGTLSLPPGPGPFPAALLITGSGQQDRDESLLGHRPFLVIADYLTRNGIAVLRVDDRGIGQSAGNFTDATTEDFAGDVQAGVAFLMTRPEIAPRKIGLIGHSEGAVIAPLVASRSKDVAFVVMLAGTGVPGDQVLMVQNERILRAGGASEQSIKDQLAALREVMSKAMQPGSEEALKQKVRELLRIQIAASPLTKQGQPTDQEMQELVDESMKSLGSRWFSFFLAYDPRLALRKVKVPVLVLNGEKDTQVDAEQNLPAIEAALKEAGNGNVTMQKIPGVNHLFQKCRTGSPMEYGQISETFSPDVLKLMGDWIHQHFANTR